MSSPYRSGGDSDAYPARGDSNQSDHVRARTCGGDNAMRVRMVFRLFIHAFVAPLVAASCAERNPSPAQSTRSDSITIQVLDTRVAAACYRSPHSVLLGPPTSASQQGRGPGWIGLESGQHTDSGWAQLVDAGGTSYNSIWRRDATDSIALRVADDFLHLSMRLAVSDSLIVGSALAHSDAELERDESGRLVDLRREWMLHATRAPCDSMPRGWTP